jgi:hypothetical protein
VPNEALIVGLERGVKGSVILIEGVARGKKPAGDVILNTVPRGGSVALDFALE